MAEMGDLFAPGEKKDDQAQGAAKHDGKDKGPRARIVVEQRDEERQGHGKSQKAKEKADQAKDASGVHQK
jgi:hypothetical protein